MEETINYLRGNPLGAEAGFSNGYFCDGDTMFNKLIICEQLLGITLVGVRYEE